MNYDYGCQILNRYNFFLDKEDEDPSDLLAQVNTNTEKSTTTKDTKQATKDSKTSKTTNTKQGQTSKSTTGSAKDGKKPLEQQKSNAGQPNKGSSDDRKDSAKQNRDGKPSRPNQQGPREDKENNRTQRVGGGAGDDNNNKREFFRRPPRNQNQTGGDQNQNGENRQGGEPGNNDDRPRRTRVFRPRRFPQENNDQEPVPNENNQDGTVQPQAQQGDDNKGQYRQRTPYRGGRGGGRGFRGGGYTNRRAPREFDRHSGSDKTGVKPLDKKDGAGKSNWGTVDDELAATEEPINETSAEAVPTEENKDWAKTVDEHEQKESGEAKEEEGPTYMTLDEFRALKSQLQQKNQQFNIRQPGEGEEPNRWGATYVLQKKKDEEDEEEDEDEEEEEEEGEEGEEDDEKTKLVEEIKKQLTKFTRTVRSGRGGRGGNAGAGAAAGNDNKGGENRRPKGPRTPNKEINVPRIDDDKDFPSLSKA